jgi:hypothetical protein
MDKNIQAVCAMNRLGALRVFLGNWQTRQKRIDLYRQVDECIDLPRLLSENNILELSQFNEKEWTSSRTLIRIAP